jgi:SNF2 family DNA or RNA helicase
MLNITLLDKAHVKVEFGYNQKIVEALQTLPSAQYVDTKKGGKYWKVLLFDLFMIREVLKPMMDAGFKVIIDQKVKDAYAEQLEFYKNIRELGARSESEFKPVGLKKGIKPYNFQLVAANFLINVEKGLAALDMGLGKTLTAIMAALKLIKDKKVKKILVICPASLKYNWALEIAKFTDCTYQVIEGDAKKRSKQYSGNHTFIIMNYDLLRTGDIEHVSKIEWDLIISDEIQRAKNYATATSKKIRTLDAPYIFALTGTPIENDVMDLFTIMKFINPNIFGSNPKRFKDRYCDQNYFGAVTGYKHLDEIKKKLSNVMIRRKKRDVLEELPDKVVQYYYVNLNEEERKLYKQYKSGIIEGYNGGKLKHIDVLAQVVYLREICDSLNLINPGEKVVSSKLEELKKIIADLPKESKVVIFSAFERMTQIIQKELPYKSLRLHGGVENNCVLEAEIEKDTKKNFKNLKQAELDLKIHEEKKKAICKGCPYYNDDEKCFSRKKITNKFNNEPDIKLFISTDAGKEGLNLQSADTFVNYDMSFNPAVNEQRIARIDRIGQLADKILIVNMVCYDTIEIRMLDILERKQKIFDLVVDDSDNDLLKKMSANTIMQII